MARWACCRYCDDFVILCETRTQAEAALREVRALLADLRLELADANALVHLDTGGEGSFDFLGFHHRMVESFSKPGRYFMARWPSAAATKRPGRRSANSPADDASGCRSRTS